MERGICGFDGRLRSEVYHTHMFSIFLRACCPICLHIDLRSDSRFLGHHGCYRIGVRKCHFYDLHDRSCEFLLFVLLWLRFDRGVHIQSVAVL